MKSMRQPFSFHALPMASTRQSFSLHVAAACINIDAGVRRGESASSTSTSTTHKCRSRITSTSHPFTTVNTSHSFLLSRTPGLCHGLPSWHEPSLSRSPQKPQVRTRGARVDRVHPPGGKTSAPGSCLHTSPSRARTRCRRSTDCRRTVHSGALAVATIE